MALALDCWNYNLLEESHSFCQAFGGAKEYVNIVTKLSSKLNSDVHAINIY